MDDFTAEKFLGSIFSSDNNSVLAGEGGVFAASLTLHIAFSEFKAALNMELPKDKMTIEEVYVEFSKKVEIMSLDEINQCAQKFINDFINNHGGHGLRIYWETQRRGIGNNKRLESKYFRYVKDLIKYYNEWMENNLNVKYKIEAYLIGEKIKGLYYTKYAFDVHSTKIFSYNDDTEQLWGIIKTIRQTFYNQELIDTLHSEIQDLAEWCCPIDYIEADLKNKDVIHSLYVELCEVLGKDDGYGGDQIFMKYDGYGKVLYEDGDEKKDLYRIEL